MIETLCAICGKGIPEPAYERGVVADRPVRKAGELAYIELAHLRCAVGREGWMYDELPRR